jgi:uncharacterized Zn finger protein (UPF0148 family)
MTVWCPKCGDVEVKADTFVVVEGRDYPFTASRRASSGVCPVCEHRLTWADRHGEFDRTHRAHKVASRG